MERSFGFYCGLRWAGGDVCVTTGWRLPRRFRGRTDDTCGGKAKAGKSFGVVGCAEY